MIRFLSITPFRTALVVVFLSIYPKRGPMQKIDLEEHELERLMNTFTTEFNSQQTVFHDIDNSLEVTSIH